MTGRLAVLAVLAMLAPAFAQDKPNPKFEKVQLKTITLHIDASKLPPDVLAALMKLAEAQKSAETKKGDGEKPGGKKGEFIKPGVKKGEGEKPGGKKGGPVKPGVKGEFSKKPAPAAPMSLGHAVMLVEKKGQTVVKAEAVGGVYVLQLADGSTMKLEAATKGGKGGDGGGKGGGKGGDGSGGKGGKGEAPGKVGSKGEEPKKK